MKIDSHHFDLAPRLFLQFLTFSNSLGNVPVGMEINMKSTSYFFEKVPSTSNCIPGAFVFAWAGLEYMRFLHGGLHRRGPMSWRYVQRGA